MSMLVSYRTLLIALLFASLSPGLCAQTPIANATRTADAHPMWPGCTAGMPDCTKSKLAEFIASNIQIPGEARSGNFGGVVMVEFVIEKNGQIGEVHLLHDPGYGLGNEALRVISKIKEKKIKWTPAEMKGKRVPFRYMVPVRFDIYKPLEEKAPPPVTELDMPEIYEVAEVMPRFAGCETSETDTMDCTFLSIIHHIKTNLVYPDTALSAGVQGPVVVEFVIDPSGLITNPNVKEGIGYGCDEEALRIISLMPAWQPALESGRPVALRMVIPVVFQIPKSAKE